jgi:hypothetical protein
MTTHLTPPQARREREEMPAKVRRRWKPALPAPTEHQEQCMLFAWANVMAHQHPELLGLYAIPNAGGYSGGFSRNVVRVKEMLREGVKPGYPDVGLDVARGGYHGLRIEMKRIRGSGCTVEQKTWHMWLADQGYYVAVCEGAEAAQNVLLWYLDGAK